MSDAALRPIRDLIEGCWPGEWGTDPMGDRSNCIVYRATDIDNQGRVDLAGGAERVVPPAKLEAKSLKVNDILLEASGGAPDKPVGRVALITGPSRKPAITSNFFRFMRPRSNVDAQFLTHQLVALNRSSAIWRYQQQTTGLINLKVADYLRHAIWVPSVPLQRKIAAVLTNIDTAIERTEALIAKYQQIKAGLMHDLFTRGVLPSGQLRPSRDEAPELYQKTAIGWIPKEWHVSSLSGIADLLVGFAFKSDSFQIDGIPLLRGENVGFGRADWSDRQCLSPHRQAEFAGYLLKSGDLVIGMDRTFTRSGVKITRLTSEDCPSLLVQRVGKFIAVRCEFSYLSWLVQSAGYLRLLFGQQKGMDIPHLSKAEILSPVVPVPSTSEQIAIAQRTYIATRMIEVANNELEALKMQKLGLMQDLLTGKVPVNVTEPIPEPLDA
jgi:type I restriction enzyme, S subunit